MPLHLGNRGREGLRGTSPTPPQRAGLTDGAGTALGGICAHLSKLAELHAGHALHCTPRQSRFPQHPRGRRELPGQEWEAPLDQADQQLRLQAKFTPTDGPTDGRQEDTVPVHSPRAFLWLDIQLIVIDVNFWNVHFKEVGL